MRLRTRIVLSCVAIFAVGLVVAMGATFGAMQDLRSDRTDELMRVMTTRVIDSGASDPGSVVDALDIDNPGWQALAEAGTVPSFFQVRTADGQVLRTVSFGLRPDLAGELPDAMQPGERDGATSDIRSVATRPGGAVENPPGWRALSLRVPDAGGLILVVAARTDADEDFSRRLGAVAATITVAVLGAVALVTYWLLRRHLRPLEQMVAVAGRIGAGDLRTRVVVDSPAVEIGQVAHAFNQMADDIEKAFAEREQSEQRLRQFVADASHELRTPLASVQGYAELFRHTKNDPDHLAQLLSRIEQETNRMSVLVDELLLLARLDAGRALEQNPVDLAQVTAEAVDTMRVRHPGRAISLAASGDCSVVGDELRLRQVIDNLLVNACRHTPADASVDATVGRDGATVVLAVADNGPGIPDDLRERVFDRFYRVTETNSGSGLGLSIVSAVMTAHGGTVEITDGPDGGARVVLRLTAAGPG